MLMGDLCVCVCVCELDLKHDLSMKIHSYNIHIKFENQGNLRQVPVSTM